MQDMVFLVSNLLNSISQNIIESSGRSQEKLLNFEVQYLPYQIYSSSSFHHLNKKSGNCL